MKEMEILAKIFNINTLLYWFGKMVLMELIFISIFGIRHEISNLIFCKRSNSNKKYITYKFELLICIVTFIGGVAFFCLISAQENIITNICLWVTTAFIILFKSDEKVCVPALIASILSMCVVFLNISSISNVPCLIVSVVLFILSVVTTN